jgi:hypothetical protein
MTARLFEVAGGAAAFLVASLVSLHTLMPLEGSAVVGGANCPPRCLRTVLEPCSGLYCQAQHEDCVVGGHSDSYCHARQNYCTYYAHCYLHPTDAICYCESDGGAPGYPPD